MLQIPYSILRMLCHILIGFVGGTIFINSGKLPAMHSFHDAALGHGSPVPRTSVISLPLREIAGQGQPHPGEDKPRQFTD